VPPRAVDRGRPGHATAFRIRREASVLASIRSRPVVLPVKEMAGPEPRQAWLNALRLNLPCARASWSNCRCVAAPSPVGATGGEGDVKRMTARTWRTSASVRCSPSIRSAIWTSNVSARWDAEVVQAGRRAWRTRRMPLFASPWYPLPQAAHRISCTRG
jgi:hypothetical protein